MIQTDKAKSYINILLLSICRKSIYICGYIKDRMSTYESSLHKSTAADKTEKKNAKRTKHLSRIVHVRSQENYTCEKSQEISQEIALAFNLILNIYFNHEKLPLL